MTEQTASSSSADRLELAAKAHKFKSIHELGAKEGDTQKNQYVRPTPVEILDWSTDKAEAGAAVVTNQTVTLILGAGEQVAVPCLAVARFSDHLEVLNVDGKTHCLLLEEVAA